MGGTKEIWIAASALSLVLSAQDAAAQLGQKSGVVQAGIPEVTGTTDTGGVRTLNVGDAVFHDQVVSTGPRGRVKLVMLDRSSILLGPNSEITIQAYEYNRTERTGRMVLKASKGLFRLVGGLISKKNPVRVTTINGTIGIRGGMGILDVGDGTGPVDFAWLYGDEATHEETGTTVTRPGSRMKLNSPSSVDTGLMPGEELARLANGFQGPPAPGQQVPPITQVTPAMVEVTPSDTGQLQQQRSIVDDEYRGSDDTRQAEYQDLADQAMMGTG